MCNTISKQAWCPTCLSWYGLKEKQPSFKCPTAKQMLGVLGACGKLEHLNVRVKEEDCAADCKERRGELLRKAVRALWQ